MYVFKVTFSTTISKQLIELIQLLHYRVVNRKLKLIVSTKTKMIEPRKCVLILQISHNCII